MGTSSSLLAGFALAGIAGIAHASPKPPHYHVADAPWEWHDSELRSVNANGVAAGDQFGNQDQGIVWKDGTLTLLGCDKGEPYSAAHSINDAMQVVGYCLTTAFQYVATLWAPDGSHITISDHGVPANTADAINNKGLIAGSKDGIAYSWKNGKFKSLGTLGGTQSNARGINDNGWIVGGSMIAGDTSQHAYVYRQGVMSDLGWGGDQSWARAVNAKGHIAGTMVVGPNNFYHYHAMFDTGSGAVDLGNLGHVGAEALGVNNLDQVVGYSRRNDFSTDGAFIYTHGRMYDLNKLLDAESAAHWVVLVAYAINDSGVIVGYGASNGSYEPVVMTPLP